MRTLILAVVVLLPGSAIAQEREQPVQELFLTQVVYPQERHEVQLTIGNLIDQSRDDRAALVPFTVEYGLTDRWQIEAEWAGFTQFHESPLANLKTARTSIGTKYSFMNIGGSHVHAAVGMDVEFPRVTAFDAEDEGEQGVEFEPALSMAVDIGDRITMFGSAGLSIEKQQAEELLQGTRPDDRGTISVGGLVAFRHVTLAVEYTNRSDDLPWRLDGSPLVTPSAIFHPGGHWELGIGMPVGVRAGSRMPGVAWNVTKEF